MQKVILSIAILLLATLSIANAQSNNTGNNTNPSNSSVPVMCTLNQSNALNCSVDFSPVCGYNSSGLGSTFTNVCLACTSSGIVSYTTGYCPFSVQLPTIEFIQSLKYYCTQQEKEAQVCTLEYNPVCGYSDGSSLTYGNRCQGCAAKGVKYILPGECPNTK